MDDKLSRLLEEIYESGVEHDSKTADRSKRMLNITPDAGLFLSILVRAVRAERVLEIGTSNGYSTIWIADALRQEHGKVVSVEVSREKEVMARGNLERSGLSDFVDLREGDAGSLLRTLDSRSFDLVFMDAERTQYLSYWEDVDRVLRPGGTLLVDNAIEPKPEELVDFFAHVNGSGRYTSQVLPVGKGEFLAVKLEDAR
jgi:predicted O-methyltransferase YrrM